MRDDLEQHNSTSELRCMWLTMNLWPTLEDFKPEESEQEGFGGEQDGACGGS